jgi:hypothetical protein
MAPTRAALNEMREVRRADLAFLYSTPAYRRQLDELGLDHVGAELTEMAHRNQWDDMRSRFTDDVMNILVPQGIYDDIPDVLLEWYAGLCSGISLSIPNDDADDLLLARVVERCRDIQTCRV